jgi:hypothetical protein
VLSSLLAILVIKPGLTVYKEGCPGVFVYAYFLAYFVAAATHR